MKYPNPIRQCAVKDCQAIHGNPLAIYDAPELMGWTRARFSFTLGGMHYEGDLDLCPVHSCQLRAQPSDRYLSDMYIQVDSKEAE